IFGNNFGATQGSSYITVGGGQVASYQVWGENNANNPHLDMITFQLGSNAQTGDIVLHTSEGDSNGLGFTVRVGNIYFVDDLNGNDSNEGSYENPWKTLSKVGNNLVTGSTYYFRAGTWLEQISLGGTSPHGLKNNEIALVAYPEEIARWEGSYNFNWGYSRNYYIIAGFQFYASGSNTQIRGYGNRFINNDCEGLKTHAYSIINPRECNYAKVYGNTLHGATSGNKLDHPLYIGYGADNVDFGWNYIYNNNVWVGPLISINQDYGQDFENLLIHDNIIDGSGYRPRGIGIIWTSPISSVSIYNNLFIDCGGDIINGPYTLYQISGNSEIYDNTFYNCDGSYAISIREDPAANIYSKIVNVKNNIIHTKSGSSCDYIFISTNPLTGPIAVDSNLYYGNDNGPVEDLNPINADPQFINPFALDFHLQPTSPAIDAGTSTVSSIVTQDFDGILRPQNFLFDIGAYEYDFNSPLLTCTDAGGTCQTNSCSNYQDCTSLSGTCSSGNCCSGTCTEIILLNCTDSDGDGYNQSQTGCGIADCNDLNSLIYPGATEVCGNGVDEDCSGSDLECSVNESEEEEEIPVVVDSGSSGGGSSGGGSSSTPECVLTNAFWSVVSAVEGQQVSLTVEGTDCDSEEIDLFVIWEDDLIGDDSVNENPSTVGFSDGKAVSSWTVEYQDDFFGKPEYYFVSTLKSDSSVKIDSRDYCDLLRVDKAGSNMIGSCPNYVWTGVK
ncbi:MAG: choice-of-anchor Q domain-containing protein, partial [archaeon]